MKVVVITGTGGLVGSEAARFYASRVRTVVGMDNDMRQFFFGADASTQWNLRQLVSELDNYVHYDVDIRDRGRVEAVFREYSTDIEAVIHAAAQPSHDWAARDPHTDFSVNAGGTLVLLEAARQHCPDAPFVFTSTNKVYGDGPNRLPLVELETRWELPPEHRYFEHGIDETMKIDQTTHSLFGVSKLAADALVQEYGRYFGMNTVCFRAGCITGPQHAGTMLHGFLAYLVKCTLTGQPYTVFGYKGKQVRDNIHAHDLVSMFWHYCLDPQPGEVYNAGGGRHSNCSVQEAIALCEQLSGRRLKVTYSDEHRKADHVWYISDVRKYQARYPDWAFRFDLQTTLKQMLESMARRL